jgi:antitoxin component YwqK of YwqJK toxin-antitoxin module
MKTLITILCIYISHVGYSCSCSGGMEMREFNIIDFLKYDEIVLGVINSKDKCHSQNIKVIESFKKDIHGELLIVNESTVTCNSSCDTEYNIGDTVLFYLFKDSNKWTNINCSKTINVEYLTIQYSNYKMSKSDLYNYALKSLRYLKENATSYYQEMKHPNGNLIYKGKIINGRANGEWVFYDASGKVTKKGSYKNGIKNGIWNYFITDLNSEYGKITGYLDGNLKIGKWFYYDKDDKLIKEELYYNGQLVKEIKK